MQARNKIIVISLSLLIGITSCAIISLGNPIILSLSPSTSIQPITARDITFNVYDGINPHAPGSALNPSLGFVGSGETFVGGIKYPGVDTFTSQPFFVNHLGGIVGQPEENIQHVVVGGKEYIAVGTYYGIDVGARTHVDLGSVNQIHITMNSATVSPFANMYWYAHASDGAGADYQFSDTLSNQIGPGSYDDPNQGRRSINPGIDYNGVYGSTTFVCGAGTAGNLAETWYGGLTWTYHYTWGSGTGDGAASITQSLAPFYDWYGNPISDLDGDWLDFESRTYPQNQVHQADYVMSNYKVAKVKVVPTVNLDIQTAPVWSNYEKAVRLSNGTLVNVKVVNSGFTSGIKSAYPANLTQYIQAGKITTNTFQPVVGTIVVPVTTDPADNPGVVTGGGVLSKLFYGSGVESITGDLTCIGDQTDFGTLESRLEPARSGTFLIDPSVRGTVLDGDYHFNINTTSFDPASFYALPQTASLSSSFTMQPAVEIGYAHEHVDSNYYIYNGNYWEKFNIGPIHTKYEFNYPYKITINNVYCVQRWVIEVWSLSSYDITCTATGSSINAAMLTDAELYSIINNPSIDDNHQSVPMPKGIDWLTIAIVIIAAVVAIFIVAGVAEMYSQKISTEVQMVAPRQSFADRTKKWLSGGVNKNDATPSIAPRTRSKV